MTKDLTIPKFGVLSYSSIYKRVKVSVNGKIAGFLLHRWSPSITGSIATLPPSESIGMIMNECYNTVVAVKEATAVV